MGVIVSQRFVLTVHYLLCSLLVPVFSMTDCLTLEERVQKLEHNYVQMKRILEVRVKNLESKVRRLETHIQNAPNLNHHYRSCHEARQGNPLLGSGMYWIDPDGQGVGDDPIHVHCNMTTGSTLVPHDSEAQMDVGPCEDPGCYSREIKYSATVRQMSALTELSNECHQSITYDCINAPLEFNKVAHSWWIDKNGDPQYFWTGSNTSVLHTCQCGIDGACYESSEGILCNCDSSIRATTIGIITDKTLLPITRLHFGRIVSQSSSGQHTLGRLECTGQVSVIGVPKSCQDLRLIGHTKSGLYSVMGHKTVEIVYCDFKKGHNELRIGYADVKSLPVYFYVQRNFSFDSVKEPISFHLERLNAGRAMNLTSGIFTAPRPGKYFFSFSGVVRFGDSDRCFVSVSLMLNGRDVGYARSDETRLISDDFDYDTLSIQATLDLKSGCEIWLQINERTGDQYIPHLYDETSQHYTHFTGWLIEEDLSPSLENV